MSLWAKKELNKEQTIFMNIRNETNENKNVIKLFEDYTRRV
jgi:hypothetical protein